jgi:hypothetical protein
MLIVIFANLCTLLNECVFVCVFFFLIFILQHAPLHSNTTCSSVHIVSACPFGQLLHYHSDSANESLFSCYTIIQILLML